MLTRIATYARKEAGLIAACGAVPTILTGFYSAPLAVVPAGLTIAALGFFRDPERRCDAGPMDLVAPADGRVILVETVDDPPMFVEGPALRIAIFMSLFNVHVNRVPCDGVVDFVQHERGSHMNAAYADAATKNARCYMGITRDDGRKILVTQVAGLVARGIVCDCEKGARLTQGQRFGMIKLGSRLETLLPNPDAFEVNVSVGDKAIAGVTILGTYQ